MRLIPVIGKVVVSVPDSEEGDEVLAAKVDDEIPENAVLYKA